MDQFSAATDAKIADQNKKIATIEKTADDFSQAQDEVDQLVNGQNEKIEKVRKSTALISKELDEVASQSEDNGKSIDSLETEMPIF